MILQWRLNGLITIAGSLFLAVFSALLLYPLLNKFTVIGVLAFCGLNTAFCILCALFCRDGFQYLKMTINHETALKLFKKKLASKGYMEAESVSTVAEVIPAPGVLGYLSKKLQTCMSFRFQGHSLLKSPPDKNYIWVKDVLWQKWMLFEKKTVN